VDPTTRARLRRRYPNATRASDAARFGVPPTTFGAYIYGSRPFPEELAQIVSSETGIAVQTLRGWDFDPPDGVRWRDIDPMPRANIDDDALNEDLRWLLEHRAAALPDRLRDQALRLAHELGQEAA